MPCTSFTLVTKKRIEGKNINMFYLSVGDCKEEISRGKKCNLRYFYFEAFFGFTTSKDKFDEFNLRIIECY